MAQTLDKAINIIILVLDTVRYDALSCYGLTAKTTPKIDAFAEDALVFSNAIANSCWSIPSYVSLLSGLFLSEHHVNDLGDKFNSEMPSIPKFLEKFGYDTISFSNNTWLSLIGVDKLFNEYYEITEDKKSKQHPRLSKARGYFKKALFLKDKGAARTNKEIINWIKKRKKGKKEKPYFLFVNYMEAHGPYFPKRPYHRKFHTGSILSSIYKMVRVYKNDAVFKGYKLSKNDVDSFKNLYLGSVSYLDQKLGELFDFLKQEGELDNTMVMITADHGESFAEHKLNGIPLLNHNFSLYDELIRVPLIIRAPMLDKKRIESQVQLSDIFQTIAQILGKRDDATTRSPARSIMDKIKQPSSSKYAFSEYRSAKCHLKRLQRLGANNIDRFNIKITAVRTNSHKYIDFGDRYELLETSSYPDRIINNGKKPRIMAELKNARNLWRESLHSYKNIHEDVFMDKVIRRRLQNLGYL